MAQIKLIPFAIGVMLLMALIKECSAQDIVSPYRQPEVILDANMRTLATHGYCTQITYFDLNFVNLKVQEFLYRHLGASTDETGDFKTLKNNDIQITQKYNQRIVIDEQSQTLTIRYTAFRHKNAFVIKSAVITGTSKFVIDFFVKFWQTALTFNDIYNDKIATTYLLQDKATISFKNDMWSIEVTNTSIKSMDDFKKIFEDKVLATYNVSKAGVEISFDRSMVDRDHVIAINKYLNDKSDGKYKLKLILADNNKLNVYEEK